MHARCIILPWRLKANNALTQQSKKVPAMIFLGNAFSFLDLQLQTTPLTPRLTTTGCKVVAMARDRYAALM